MDTNKRWRDLVSANVSVTVTASDALGKGFLSSDEAEAWILADNFVSDNYDDLLEENSGRSAAIIFNLESSEYDTYVGNTDAEAMEVARQFGSAPYVLISDESVPEMGEVGGFIGEIVPIEEATGTEVIGNRPFVNGTIDFGNGATKKKYLIDTGAGVSCINEDNFAKLVKKGAKPKPAGNKKVKTAGGEKNVKVYKGKMTFKRQKVDGKGVEEVSCDRDFYVIPSSNILGMDQLEKTETTLFYDPAGKKIELKGRSKPKHKKK